MRWFGWVAGPLALVLALAACGGDDDDAGDGGSEGDRYGEVVDMRGKAEGDEYPALEVVAKDNEFIPKAVRIDPGVTIKWDNEGRSPHNVLAADPDQDFGGEFGVQADDFGPGDEYEFRFDDEGVYTYYCSLHGSPTAGMIGAVLVGDAEFAGGESGGAEKVSGTLEVPDDYESIQAAVDVAAPGSLILVGPGTYNEAVTVTTEDLVIRGLDRNEVVLDGEFELDNGFKVLADGVAIENMTAQNYTVNGFFWQGVKGFRGSYLTAIRNGDYGIYSFDAIDGQFDHSYASGSPDAGYYVGQCYPCNVVLSEVEAEWNGLGYSGTNAGGDLFIVRSSFHDNRGGIVPNSGTGEANPPEKETTVVGNVVYSNNNAETSAITIAEFAFANGIVVAGGVDNVVERNLVYDHDHIGIAVVPMPETLLDPDDPDAEDFDSIGNRIVGNVVRDSRAADLALLSSITKVDDPQGNCFSDNLFETSFPADLEVLAPCDATGTGAYTGPIAELTKLFLGDNPEGADYKKVPLPDPGDLPNMPDAKTAKARPARGPLITVDLDSIEVPEPPE